MNRHLAGCRLLAAAALAALAAESAVGQGPNIADIVELADISGLAASTDGHHVAFRVERASIDRNSHELRWFVADLRTGRVAAAAGGGEPIVEDPGFVVTETPHWSADSRWFHYRALGRDGVQVRRTAADGSESAVVTQEAGDVLSIAPDRGSDAILLEIAPPRAAIERAELAEYDSGILVDEHVELGQNLFQGAIVNGRPATQRLTGRWFARGGILWRQAPSRRRLDLGTLEVTDVQTAASGTTPEGVGGTAAEARSAQGDLATARWEGGRATLAGLRADGSRVICQREACRSERIVWLAWRPGRDQILFATEDRAHVQSLHGWDVVRGEVRLVAASDGLLNGGRRADAPCAVTEHAAVCVSAEPVSPPRLERVDLESGARQVLFDPNALLRAKAWPLVERLTWISHEGRLFTGVLFRPRTGEGLPLFINYYRCEGFLRGGVGDEWPLLQMAENGMAAVCINATRSSGPQDAVAQYREALGGIERLVDLLARRGLVDRGRVGMGGLSFGSEVTMWAVMHSDLVAAASVASPQFEPASYWFNAVRGRDHPVLLRRVWGLGAPEETPERWRLVSPALNVERIRAPLLMQLPEQEARYAIEFYARLTNSPTPAEMHVFPDERHIKFQPRHRLAAYRRNLDWFRFWLQDAEDPDPARSGQYLRWRRLAARASSAQPRRDRSQSSSEARSSNR